jgi:glycine/D-amino acid oxidase-like deaminating enzyme
LSYSGPQTRWRNQRLRPELPQRTACPLRTCRPRWLQRCARRIAEVERDIDEAEARRIARDLHSFERTRAMEPEAAVDFVVRQRARPGCPVRAPQSDRD